MKNLIALFLLSCVFCATALAAQLKVGPIYKDGPGEIAVLVEILSEDTSRASDFQLLLDRQPVASAKDIKTFNGSGKTLSLVLCVDVSGPMKEQALSAIKAALFYLIGRAADRPEDRIALVTFADDITIASSFDSSRDQLVDAVMQLHSRGSHARLYHALYKSLELLNRQDLPERRRIIAISGGKDEGGVGTVGNVISKASGLGCPIDVVSYGKMDSAFQHDLSEIIESAGGRLIDTNPETVNVKAEITKFYEDMLEARSLMVYFTYEAELMQGETQDAAISVARAGQNAKIIAIPGNYARPKRPQDTMPGDKGTVTPSRKESQLPISRDQSWMDRKWISVGKVALGAALVFALTLFLLLRRLKANKTDRPEEMMVAPCETPAQDTVLAQVSTPVTMVGGYLFPPPRGDRPIAELIGLDGPLANTCHTINEEIFKIGRAEENDLCILNDDFVSRHHAYLRYEKGSLFIFDNSSEGGTFVNGKKMTVYSVPLEPGDQIKIGLSVLEVKKCDDKQR